MKRVRSRSVQLEKGSIRVAPVEPVTKTAATSVKRAASQPTGAENVAPGPRASAASTSTPRSYRSMLDAGTPTITPFTPMSYEELYPRPTRQPPTTHPSKTKKMAQVTEPPTPKTPEGPGPGQLPKELSRRTSLVLLFCFATVLGSLQPDANFDADPTGAPARASPSPNGKPDEYPTEDMPMPNKAKAPSANDPRNVVRRKLTGYVGFANLPNQWHRKSVRKGFNFNVMVVGKICSGPAMIG